MLPRQLKPAGLMDATAQPVRPADGAHEVAAPQKQRMATAASAFSAQLAASDSSGAENSGSTRQTVRQGSFASTNTEQPLMPPIPDAKPKLAAAHRPGAAATAAAIMQEPPAAVVAVVATGEAQPAASGSGTGIRLAATAVKLEPVPYDGGGGSSGISGGSSDRGLSPADVVLKSEPCSQLAAGQQAVARALCNRQSAARSKVGTFCVACRAGCTHALPAGPATFWAAKSPCVHALLISSGRYGVMGMSPLQTAACSPQAVAPE